MSQKGAIWKIFVAGFCGMIAHSLLMYFKSRLGLFPTFQPYQSLQASLSQAAGANVPTFVPWTLSFVNGTVILGFLFARINRFLPGRSGVAKGLTFGLIAWVVMNAIFFPAIGLGPFAMRVGEGFGPALLSLAMLLAYSMVLGSVYVALNSSD